MVCQVHIHLSMDVCVGFVSPPLVASLVASCEIACHYQLAFLYVPHFGTVGCTLPSALHSTHAWHCHGGSSWSWFPNSMKEEGGAMVQPICLAMEWLLLKIISPFHTLDVWTGSHFYVCKGLVSIALLPMDAHTLCQVFIHLLPSPLCTSSTALQCARCTTQISPPLILVPMCSHLMYAKYLGPLVQSIP